MGVHPDVVVDVIVQADAVEGHLGRVHELRAVPGDVLAEVRHHAVAGHGVVVLDLPRHGLRDHALRDLLRLAQLCAVGAQPLHRQPVVVLPVAEEVVRRAQVQGACVVLGVQHLRGQLERRHTVPRRLRQPPLRPEVVHGVDGEGQLSVQREPLLVSVAGAPAVHLRRRLPPDCVVGRLRDQLDLVAELGLQRHHELCLDQAHSAQEQPRVHQVHRHVALKVRAVLRTRLRLAAVHPQLPQGVLHLHVRVAGVPPAPALIHDTARRQVVDACIPHAHQRSLRRLHNPVRVRHDTGALLGGEVCEAALDLVGLQGVALHQLLQRTLRQGVVGGAVRQGGSALALALAVPLRDVVGRVDPRLHVTRGALKSRLTAALIKLCAPLITLALRLVRLRLQTPLSRQLLALVARSPKAVEGVDVDVVRLVVERGSNHVVPLLVRSQVRVVAQVEANRPPVQRASARRRILKRLLLRRLRRPPVGNGLLLQTVHQPVRRTLVVEDATHLLRRRLVVLRDAVTLVRLPHAHVASPQLALERLLPGTQADQRVLETGVLDGARHRELVEPRRRTPCLGQVLGRLAVVDERVLAAVVEGLVLRVRALLVHRGARQVDVRLRVLERLVQQLLLPPLLRDALHKRLLRRHRLAQRLLLCLGLQLHVRLAPLRQGRNLVRVGVRLVAHLVFQHALLAEHAVHVADGLRRAELRNAPHVTLEVPQTPGVHVAADGRPLHAAALLGFLRPDRTRVQVGQVVAVVVEAEDALRQVHPGRGVEVPRHEPALDAVVEDLELHAQHRVLPPLLLELGVQLVFGHQRCAVAEGMQGRLQVVLRVRRLQELVRNGEGVAALQTVLQLPRRVERGVLGTVDVRQLRLRQEGAPRVRADVRAALLLQVRPQRRRDHPCRHLCALRAGVHVHRRRVDERAHRLASAELGGVHNLAVLVEPVRGIIHRTDEALDVGAHGVSDGVPPSAAAGTHRALPLRPTLACGLPMKYRYCSF
eukprot:Rhum_TRINITY_DN21048_c0_g1::Rhum_TRINITY_DN21048_c0_g1_i1::g.173031::m.173031